MLSLFRSSLSGYRVNAEANCAPAFAIGELPSGLLKFLYGGKLRHGLSVEAGVPIYQDLNGPQPQLDWELNINYTLEF